jgi:transcriptional regulator with XRE-family HTH domain
MSRLERERRLRRLTLAELGRRVAVSPALLGRIERAEYRAYPALRRRLAAALGVAPVELFADLDVALAAARATLEAGAQ